MDNQIINCSHPKIIVNKKFTYFVSIAEKVVINGQEHSFRTPFGQLWKVPAFIYSYKETIDPFDIDTLNKYYIPVGNDMIPIYHIVPCGHCANCLDRKTRNYVHRCILEQQYYKELPLFITLTYSDEFLPDHGVNKRDCQLYLKRLRRYLDKLKYDSKFRYILVSEYGKNTKRPHYHMIMFHNQKYTLNELKQIIQATWQKGWAYIKECDKGAYGYTMKYMRKKQLIPKGKNDTFMLSSRKNGGIGSRYLIEEIRPYVDNNLHVQSVEYLDKWTGKISTLPMCGYILNKVLPPMSSLVPQNYRDSLKMIYAHVSSDNLSYQPSIEIAETLGLFHKPLYRPQQYINEKIKPLKTFSKCESYEDMLIQSLETYKKTSINIDYICNRIRKRKEYLDQRQYEPLTCELVYAYEYNITHKESNRYIEIF